MNRIRRDELDEDDKNLDTISELRKLIQKALRESRDAQIGAKHRVQRQASMRRASLTAVFKLGMKDKWLSSAQRTQLNISADNRD